MFRVFYFLNGQLDIYASVHYLYPFLQKRKNNFLDVVARVEKSDDISSVLIRAHVLQLRSYLFQYLPGGMQFAWEIGKSNRGKNRYGNIVSCEYIPSTL